MKVLNYDKVKIKNGVINAPFHGIKYPCAVLARHSKYQNFISLTCNSVFINKIYYFLTDNAAILESIKTNEINKLPKVFLTKINENTTKIESIQGKIFLY